MVLGMLAVHALLLPLLFGSVLYIVKRGYEAQFIDNVRTQAYIFSRLVSEAMATHDARKLLNEAVFSGQVVSARLVDAGGRLLLGSPAAPPDTHFREDFFFGQGNDGVYYISVPLRGPGADGMELHLGYEEAPTRDQIAQAYRRGLYLGFAYIALTLILVGFVTSQVSRSLTRVREASRLIASGHFSHSLDIRSNVREVNELAVDLEYMRRSLVDLAEALEYQALHDPLTGLSNRTHFYDRLHQAIISSRRSAKPFCLLLVDLDRFKEVNDTHGHQVGDMLIQQVAIRLQKMIRESDTVARLGGDEFALLLFGSDVEGGVHIAEKVIGQLRTPFMINGLRLQIGGSVGISAYPFHGQGEEMLMRCADISMYEAKHSQNGIEVCKHCMDEQACRSTEVTTTSVT